MAYIWNRIKQDEGPETHMMAAGHLGGVVIAGPKPEGENALPPLRCQITVGHLVLLEAMVTPEKGDTEDVLWTRAHARTEFIILCLIATAAAGIDKKTMDEFTTACEFFTRYTSKEGASISKMAEDVLRHNLAAPDRITGTKEELKNSQGNPIKPEPELELLGEAPMGQ